MKMRDLIHHQPLIFSAYPDWPAWNKPKPVYSSAIRPLLNRKLVEETVPLQVSDALHQIHVTILAGDAAVIFRGVDDQLWDIPILCLNGETLCAELLDWREKAGLPPQRLPNDGHGEAGDLWEHVEEVVFEDPFTSALTDLAYHLEAISLIESL